MKTPKIFAGVKEDILVIKGTDPLGNKRDSMRLAENIRRYYHNQGYRGVKVWTEFHTEPTAHWAVRSNISFSMPK
jgi:hypothetical protein|tara:strand:+ start:16090 stop:16314 length:225 start_codon:yes stop_codon:yes gene_type:complete